MFELLEIARNGDFYDRIFPIVLRDAKIYDPVERLNYIKYWDGKIEELNKAIKEVRVITKLKGITDDINLYTDIRNKIAELTDILQNMNSLTVEMHREADFGQIIAAIYRVLSGGQEVVELTGSQRKELREALQSAFGLSQFKRFLEEELEVNLSEIARGESEADFFSNTIQYLKSEGRIKELIEAAKKAKPGNPKLKQFNLY
jgi:hypothetical protein